MPGTYRRCPRCHHVAPDLEMRRYVTVGRRARREVWRGFECPHCGARGFGDAFRFAPAPGTTPKPRKPRKAPIPLPPTPPEMRPTRKLTLQELLALAAGHAKLVPGEDGATLEWMKGHGEGTDRSEGQPEKALEA